MVSKPAKYAKKYQDNQQIPSVWGHGRVRVMSDVVTLSSQTSSDTIPVGAPLPKGARLLYGVLLASKSLGSARLKIGHTSDDDDYRIIATLTTSQTPTLFGVLADDIDPLTKSVQVIIDVETASLPSSGTLLVHMFYVTD